MLEINDVISVKAAEMATFFLHCMPTQAQLPAKVLNALNPVPKLYGVLVFDFDEYLQYLEEFYTKLDDSPVNIPIMGNRLDVYIKGIYTPSHAARLLHQNDTDKLKRLFMGELGLMLGLYATCSDTPHSFRIRWNGCSDVCKLSVKDEEECNANSPFVRLNNDQASIAYSLIHWISMLRADVNGLRVESFNTPKGILALTTYARFAAESRESYPLWDLVRKIQPNQ